MNKKERELVTHCLSEMSESYFRLLRAVYDLKTALEPGLSGCKAVRKAARRK